MKPLRFDMTQVADALKAPEITTRDLPQTPAEPEAEAIFPQHYMRGRSWVATMAYEQIHALATHILARHGELGMRTLAITSALAGEGKTTVTLALADKLSSSGKRVLVVDLDIHRGTLSRAAHLEEAPGAIESSGNGGEMPIFHSFRTDVEGVSIMPTGQVIMDESSIPLLSPERIQRLVARSLEHFDLVLLDCPPLTPVADTHIIGEVADTSILVVRSGSTPRDVLDQAISQYGKDKFFAAVLNRAQPHEIPYFREVYGYYRREPGKPLKKSKKKKRY